MTAFVDVAVVGETTVEPLTDPLGWRPCDQDRSQRGAHHDAITRPQAKGSPLRLPASGDDRGHHQVLTGGCDRQAGRTGAFGERTKTVAGQIDDIDGGLGGAPDGDEPGAQVKGFAARMPV